MSRREVEFSRRDVEFSRRDVTFTRRDVIWSHTLPRRDVAPHVATSFGHALCHVATLLRTSRRCLVKLSATSRRHPARRDVALFLAQEWFIFGPSPETPFHRNPSSLAHHSSPDLSETTSHRSETLRCSPTTVSHPLWQVLGHSGISTTVCPILAWVQ